MVKAEAERDYYADLDLQPSASANDVKKQFKKLALQYHPDRNPSGDTTAKFQAIQAATEVLTDPQQRAKYDAQRIRSGLLYTYTDAPPPPPRNNPSRSPGFSNFPPPPRPHPTAPKKTTFSPPPSGAQKYARFSTPDPPSWRTKDTDDAKSKTNDFKAWEHMRHGQGPIPRGRKESKSASSQPERERHDYVGHNTNNTMPRRTTPRRTEWENLPDAGMPNIKRSNTTTRVPPKSFTYAPSTPGAGGDEPQARSAYFNVSRDRPNPSRAQTNMPPPPPPTARAPTVKKADGRPAFKPATAIPDLYNGGQRIHTNYPTMHGEKTELSPGPGLHRSTTSATPRDSNSRTGFNDGGSLRANGNHVRSASASSPFRARTAAGISSMSNTSSDSSSDENEAAQKKEAANLSKSAFNRPKQQPKTRRPHIGAGAQQRSFFNPHVTVDEARDEPMVSDAGYSGPRRHSGVELPTHKRVDDPPEGFMEHRKKHEGGRKNPQGNMGPTEASAPHFMQRPKSFDEGYQPRMQEDGIRPSTANADTTPMYDPGFRWPSDDLPKPFANVRSDSTENIDVRFSPAGTPPKFGRGSGASTKMSAGEASANPIEISDNDDVPTTSNGQEDDCPPEKGPCDPPPKGPPCFFPNDWHQRAWAGTFQAEPRGSPTRPSSQRRPGPPRASSVNNAKRAGQPKAPGLQPSVNSLGDEPPEYISVPVENLSSSRVSSEGSAMEIDPVLTPPSGNDNIHHDNSTDVSPTRPLGPNPKSSNAAPMLPPRTAIPIHPEGDGEGTGSLNIGLGDFKHVKPFGGANGDGGLGSVVDDLSQALPFESRSSSKQPQTENSKKPATQNLKMPKPPKPPSAPRPLNPTTWKSYLEAMSSYMKNWTNFNNTMLSHFHIRQQETLAKQQQNPGWMSVQGDGEYDSYLDSLVEDERVRKWWEVACDDHRECIQQLGQVRQGMKEEIARAKNFPYPS